MSNKKFPRKKSQKHITLSAGETRRLATALAKKILKNPPLSSATVLLLHGDLGAGKTTFVQGLAKGLGIEEKIVSPTFIIMRKHRVKSGGFARFYHLDCYRLENEKELEVLGFKDILADPQNIIAIEWPEKMQKFLPQKTILILFNHKKDQKRLLTIMH